MDLVTQLLRGYVCPFIHDWIGQMMSGPTFTRLLLVDPSPFAGGLEGATNPLALPAGYWQVKLYLPVPHGTWYYYIIVICIPVPGTYSRLYW